MCINFRIFYTFGFRYYELRVFHRYALTVGRPFGYFAYLARRLFLGQAEIYSVTDAARRNTLPATVAISGHPDRNASNVQATPTPTATAKARPY